MNQDQQIVLTPSGSSSSLPIVQAEPIREGHYYKYRPLDAIPLEEGSGIHDFLALIRRRIWVLLGVSLASLTGLSAWILTRPPVYQGTFRMLVEPLTNNQDKLSQTLSLPTGPIDFNNRGLDYKSQIEVLRSQKVLEPILRSLQAREPKLDLETLVNRRLSIKNPPDTKLLDVSFIGENPAQVEATLKLLAARFVDYSLVERNTNLQQGLQLVNSQIAQQQRQVASLEQQVEQLRRNNDIFKPDVSAEELSKQLTELLDKRRQVQAELASAQTLYAKLQQQLGLNPAEAVTVSTLSESPTYQTLIAKLRDLEAQIAIASARFQPDSPMMLDLLDQREKLLPLINAEAQRVGGRASTIAQPGQSTVFQGKIGQNMGQQLVDAANRTQMLRAQGEALLLAETQLRQQTRNFASFARSYDAVQRNLKISSDSLTRLMIAKENLQLEITRQTLPWQLTARIDRDSIKDASGRVRKLLVAAIASALLGIAVAWLVDKLDPSFHSLDELTSDLRFACLGTIPYDPRRRRDNGHGKPMLMPGGQRRVVNVAIEQANDYYNAATPFMEAFYSVYTNIRLMGTDNPVKILTVVSTSPGDGKTTVSTNLALAAANLGERVLLVDADLRWPRLHLSLDLLNVRGLSNCLTSDSVELDKVYQIHPEEENLTILTAGPQPPDAPRLLTSNRFRALLEQWRKDFDLVVIDTPPLGHFVDAKLMASVSDGTVMVVSLNKTERQKAKLVLNDLISAIPTRFLGGIVNGVKAPEPDAYYNQAYRQIEEQKITSGVS